LFQHQENVEITNTVAACASVVEAIAAREWSVRIDPSDATFLARIKVHANFLQHACKTTRMLEEFEVKQSFVQLPQLIRAVFRPHLEKIEDSIDQNLHTLRTWGLSLLLGKQ
jgi:hypothetical protein